MKKIFTSSLLAVTTLFGYAQPTLQTSNLPQNKTYDIYNVSGFATSDLTPTGANATWDLSRAGLTYTLMGTISIVPVASTPYASAYPDANYAMKLQAGSMVMYHLFKVSTNGFEEVATELGSSGSQDFIDYRTVLPATFSFGNTANDTYQKTGQGTNSATLTYDAYGTLKIDGTVFNDVARTMRTTTASNTGAWWWHPTEMYPIANTDGSSLQVWKPSTATGISDLTNTASFGLYPNPAQHELCITSTESIQNISVYTITGELKYCGTSSTIAIEEWNTGVYFVQVNTRLGTATQKFIKQ